MSSIGGMLFPMGTHPWMAEKMVASRCADRDRAVRTHRRPSAAAPAMAEPQPVGAGRRVTRGLGTLLIVAGRRLAGPEALRTALDRSGFEPGSTVA